MLNIDEFKSLAKSEVHVFDGYVVFLRKDGVMQLQFAPGFNGALEHAKNIVSTMRKLKGAEKCLVLAIYADDNTFSKETREYIASDEVSAIVVADALIINGLALRIFGNGYLRINKPGRPTRLFNSAAEGLKWLEQFRSKN